MWQIGTDAMLFRDKHALELMRRHVNPETQRVEITQREMCKELLCTDATLTAITHRLTAAGYIKKHRTGKRGPCKIEVLPVHQEE